MQYMNKLIIGFAAIAIIGCGEKSSKEEKEDPKVEIKSVGDLTIAYYEMDKIAIDFKFYVDTQKDLEKKKKAMDDKLIVQQKAYESAAIALQNGMNSNTLSPNQAEAYQIKMRKAEEETFKIQQGEGLSLEKESMNANEVLMNKIEKYAKEFAEKNKIKLFLSKAVGGQVAYVDSTFNMTDPFIKYMNEQEDEINKDAEKK
jgi:Skp family chaperone for outer membrane proteins